MTRSATTWLKAALLVAAACQCQAAQACADPVFECVIQSSGKQVQVCQNGDALHYSFGPREGEPELSLQRPLTQVTIEPWNGMGERYWSSLEMRNGAWSYRMAVSYQRGAQADDDVRGSLTVLKQGQAVRELVCLPDTVRERIESVLTP